ncbi:reverse transcriptase [Phytophthora megakarya]|uniref:Reverse transcriptase n=1 Tax=Phytophthora megakarya TaxID=4795 RepID=A0A225UJ85_9STRA|nr:reverse transcriptase [Phytophthora megakarya]
MNLEKAFISVVKAITTKGYESAEDDVIYVHEPADVELTDYAQELAFLPDLSDHSPTELDFSAANVVNSALSADDQAKLVDVLKTHRNIMIASGNALPPPAYGVVCDINVEDHAPIKQRARRIPIRYLQKLYELLKGLLKANLVSFSDSQWASPIVKKNGEDIRLCIDYKMVKAVTAIMEYAMPLVDDLLTDLGSYLWFCSLDAASGFWAIMMTHEARKISAFICPLGHFEWLRMPFGLNNAPMIYQRMIDNALWDFCSQRVDGDFSQKR